MKEPAEKFLAEAKTIAAEHGLHDLLADCLLDEAGEGKAKTDEQRSLLHDALAQIFAAMKTTQVKGRRAVFMKRLAAVHSRLGNFSETRSWLEQALAVFEEIGDTSGSLQVFGQLSCLAGEEGNKDVAISLMLSLIERAKGKPFEHFRASAHHDLVHLMLSQGNILEGQKHFNAAKALCAGNRFPDIEDALQQTEERLGMATRYHKPARSSLAEMLRELRAWTSKFPEQADAILLHGFICSVLRRGRIAAHCLASSFWSMRQIRAHLSPSHKNGLIAATSSSTTPNRVCVANAG